MSEARGQESMAGSGQPADFTIFPAIDLLAGQVVRLAQGDPTRLTVYSDDPAQIARHWQSAGAGGVHVVSLDGAFGKDAEPSWKALRAIAASGLRVQFGGGLRDRTSLQRAFDLGAARVVIGTAAIEDPPLVDWALASFGPERVAAGIDARDGKVRVRGWLAEGGLTALELAARLRGQGLDWCVFTDIARDGVGAGVNLAASLALASATGLRVIASGGAAGIDEVRRARAAGLAGIIIGRALYEGQLDLAELLDDASGQEK